MKKSEKGAQTKTIHVVQLSQVTDHKEQCAATFCQREERITLLARHKNMNWVDKTYIHLIKKIYRGNIGSLFFYGLELEEVAMVFKTHNL